MISKSAMFGSLSFAALVAAPGGAHAGNLNTSGTACQNFNAQEVLDIDHVVLGVRNLNSDPRQIICPVVRSPLTTTPFPSFYVDGTNTPTTSTSCTMYSFDYTGVLLGSVSFTQTASTAATLDWDQAVTFPTAQLPSYAYVSVLCLIPGNSAGVLRGATAVQP
jgi:hypothetical protein